MSYECFKFETGPKKNAFHISKTQIWQFFKAESDPECLLFISSRLSFPVTLNSDKIYLFLAITKWIGEPNVQFALGNKLGIICLNWILINFIYSFLTFVRKLNCACFSFEAFFLIVLINHFSM